MLTDEEKSQLKALQEKDSKTNVIRLIPGGKQDDNPLVEKLRQLLASAEQGHFEEFIFIGLYPGGQSAMINWAGALSFSMLGALYKAVHILNNR
jgi:hypothetical protein